MQETIKLYDEDAYRTSFTAKVISCEKTKKGYEVILDKTCFFPEEGGQSSDTGVLTVGDDIIKVLDVQIDNDKVIRHITKKPVEENKEVLGEINWEKRFSDMQQHSAEHIVSGLIHNKYGYNNVGFHLSANEVTLDIDGMLSQQQLDEIELAANKAVFMNLNVNAEYPSKETLETLDYRSKKEIDGAVRIVTIPRVDVCACCAPHVSHTGEIGLIKIVRAVKYKSGVRINILCGERGLIDAQIKQKQIERIGAALSVKQEKTADAVDKLQKELGQMKLQLTVLNKQLAAGKAQSIPEGTANVCIFEKDMDKDAQRELVNLALERCTGYAGVFIGTDESGYRYIVGSKDSDAREINTVLKEKCQARGGGSPQMVQGSLNGSEKQIREIFE